LHQSPCRFARFRANGSPIAKEALDRIASLYGIALACGNPTETIAKDRSCGGDPLCARAMAATHPLRR
jgi:hypothetical protein